MKKTVILTAALVLAGTGLVNASPLTYRPINPSFGGNPFNSDHLLQLAEIQRQFENDDDPFSRDPIQDFTDTLQRRLLSELSRDITDAIFGENAAENGTFTVEGTTISFERVGDQVLVTISDGDTTTTITLPVTQF